MSVASFLQRKTHLQQRLIAKLFENVQIVLFFTCSCGYKSRRQLFSFATSSRDQLLFAADYPFIVQL